VANPVTFLHSARRSVDRDPDRRVAIPAVRPDGMGRRGPHGSTPGRVIAPTVTATIESMGERRGFADDTLAGFVDRLSSAEPIPGGGSAAAVTASIAASLVAMVASLSRGRAAYEPFRATIERSDAEGRRLAERCLTLADEDAAAYGTFAAAMKMPRESEEQKAARTAALGAAATVAAQVPLAVVGSCREIVAAAEELAGRSNRNASSDLAVAAYLAVAAARSAAENVRVNLPTVPDRVVADDLGFRTDEAVADIERIARAVRSVVAAGSLREPLEA